MVFKTIRMALGALIAVLGISFLTLAIMSEFIENGSAVKFNTGFGSHSGELWPFIFPAFLGMIWLLGSIAYGIAAVLMKGCTQRWAASMLIIVFVVMGMDSILIFLHHPVVGSYHAQIKIDAIEDDIFLYMAFLTPLFQVVDLILPPWRQV